MDEKLAQNSGVSKKIEEFSSNWGVNSPWLHAWPENNFFDPHPP